MEKLILSQNCDYINHPCHRIPNNMQFDIPTTTIGNVSDVMLSSPAFHVKLPVDIAIIMSDLKKELLKFMDMPTEKKENLIKNITDGTKYLGYTRVGGESTPKACDPKGLFGDHNQKSDAVEKLSFQEDDIDFLVENTTNESLLKIIDLIKKYNVFQSKLKSKIWNSIIDKLNLNLENNPEDYLAPTFIRCLMYPENAAGGMGPHTDIGLFTVIWQSVTKKDCLEILVGGVWYSIKAREDCVLIITGEFLNYLAGYPALPHRVLSPGEKRISIVNFVAPTDLLKVDMGEDGPYDWICEHVADKTSVTYSEFMKVFTKGFTSKS